MPLTAGARVGPYEIVSALGAGGMGEVYRARDAKLNRDVALKVLPEIFALDPDRLARFKREAQVLASLNHPNIAAIYGFEESNGVQALVLELVEGVTLADVIARANGSASSSLVQSTAPSRGEARQAAGVGPRGIPIDEALPIARQIAEALEAAHEQGIVHRDLKPANIKLRPDGTVKVLDFGLAKALDLAPTSIDASQSPTITSPAMTRMGVIMGTAAYMSPEQARGKAVDKRSDIWAFGCVLYEMLAGRRAFEGEDVPDTLANVLKAQPDWSAVPETVPSPIRRLVRRSLEKDRKRRLSDIGDARLEIEDTLAMARDDGAVAGSIPKASVSQRLAPVAGAVVVTVLVVGIGTWALRPSGPATQLPVTRALITMDPFDRRVPAAPNDNRLPVPRPAQTAIALSPDGRMLILRATGSPGPQLFLRPLDRLEATSIPGTEGAEVPFFSTDGTWIGFWAGGELRKVPVAGGPATTIAKVAAQGAVPIVGASSSGDVIVFATRAGLWRVPAGGGQPQSLTTPAQDESTHRLPHVLPGGEAVLFTITKEAYRWDNAQVAVRSLVTGAQKVLFDDGADARYVPTGHIVFARRGSLMAAPFDLARLEVTGGAVAILNNVMHAVNQGNPISDSGAAQFAISARGALVYVTGVGAPDAERVLTWVDRNGEAELLPVPPREYLAPRLSPDGRRVAVHTSSTATVNSRIWAYNLGRRTLTPLTTPEERGAFGIWTPDGTRLTFLSDLGQPDLFSKPSLGDGRAERLTTRAGRSFASSWTPDGKKLIVISGSLDIGLLDLADPDRRPHPVVQTPATERQAALSRDGRWLAYTSSDSGRDEVYVQPFAGPGPRIQVSTDGGHSPAWRGDGSEIFYLSESSNTLELQLTTRQGLVRMMTVRIRADPTGLSVGTPLKLFEGQYAGTIPVTGYDVTPDGQRFLMTRRVDEPHQPPSELVLVENWFEELRRLVPLK